MHSPGFDSLRVEMRLYNRGSILLEKFHPLPQRTVAHRRRFQPLANARLRSMS